MSIVRYVQNHNGSFIVLGTDRWIRYGIEHVDLLGTELKKFNQILQLVKKMRPDHPHVIDGGSNMGSWTVPLAKANPDLEFHTFEVQRFIYLINCGNMALNGLLNVYPNWCGLGDSVGEIHIPVPDYSKTANYGAFEVQPPFVNSDCVLEYSGKMDKVRITTIDSLDLRPLFVKLDVEGMELDVVRGAIRTIDHHSPIVWCESHKSDPTKLLSFFESRYYGTSRALEGHWLFIPQWLQNNHDMQQILDG